MEELEKTISDYLDTPNSNYAILISGKWGTGKTFFLKNRIKKLIESKNYEIIYISLYGVASSQELGRELFFSSNPSLKRNRKMINIGSQISKVILNASAALGISNESKYQISMEHFLNIKENKVLCFDDLERSGMILNEVMGFINSFVEHDEIKTIILGAENEIVDEQYERFKEKLIGKTIIYSPKSETVILQMIETYRSYDEYYSFLESNKGLIIDVFESSQFKNLRSLNHGLSSFYLFYVVLNKLGNNYISHWGENILFNTLAITFEIRAGNVTEEEALKLDRTSLYIAKSAVSKGKLEDKPFIIEYNDKYFSKGANPHITLKSIISYCYSGYFDEELFTNEVRLNELGHPTSLQKLTNGYWLLEQDEFETTSTEVYTDIINGNFIFSQYAMIYTYFEDFAKHQLTSIPIEKIQEDFLTGIENSFGKYNDLIIDFNYNEMVNIQTDNRTDFYKNLTQKIEGRVEANKKRLLQQKIRKIIESTSNEKMDEFTRLIHSENHPDRDLDFIPVFSYISDDDFIEIIKKLNNSNLTNLRNVLKYRYKFSNIEDFFLSDLPTLTGIKTKLSHLISLGEMEALRRFNIELLIKTIDEIEERFITNTNSKGIPLP